MLEVLDLARSQMGRTSPDPMVGALLVKNGRVIGRGYHAEQATPHAEAFAIKKAGNKAKGSILYLNLEPCCHYGYNPPCIHAIIKAGIKKVVAAMKDPNPLVNGKGFIQLRDAGIEVKVGVLEEKARELNESFEKYINTNLPFVILKSAMSLDGKIATVTKESKYITGLPARRHVHMLRVYVDAVMVGVNTVKIDDPYLTVRDIGDENITKRNPKKIVLDAKAEIPLNAKVLKNEPEKTIIVVGEGAPKNKLEKIRRTGAMVLKAKTSGGRIDLKKLMVELGEDKITSIMIEAGGTLAASALGSGIVDKVLFFIAPKIIGGKTAPTPVAGAGFKKLSQAIDLKSAKVRMLGRDILIEGYVSK
ncbi:MAG: bifunctional diaminohydroxyphosphoribosylaminopyrimidine deaminase/5-amino-6-(5-phosphoribosylamino)uracil reductase RibD [bacterium]